ncbi:MAG: TIGR04282 family arsenosugar biosynthesis glycosyltransferase [Microthrixaceae bacterium]
MSDVEAARVAAASLSDTLVAVDRAVGSRPNVERVLYFEGDWSQWLPSGWTGLEQGGGSLGRRLDALFSQVDCPAVVFGMDTPQMASSEIEGALDAVAGGSVHASSGASAGVPVEGAVDAVFGHACDGGYWTIGFRRYVPGAFDEVPMSVPHTGRRQLEVLADLGLSVATVAELRDIDHWRDAQLIAHEHPGLETSVTVSAIAADLDRSARGAR